MNIYITGLNYSINDADLNDLFAEYGEITSAKVIMDRETGRSRGFGFNRKIQRIWFFYILHFHIPEISWHSTLNSYKID